MRLFVTVGRSLVSRSIAVSRAGAVGQLFRRLDADARDTRLATCSRNLHAFKATKNVTKKTIDHAKRYSTCLIVHSSRYNPLFMFSCCQCSATARQDFKTTQMYVLWLWCVRAMYCMRCKRKYITLSVTLTALEIVVVPTGASAAVENVLDADAVLLLCLAIKKRQKRGQPQVRANRSELPHFLVRFPNVGTFF